MIQIREKELKISQECKKLLIQEVQVKYSKELGDEIMQILAKNKEERSLMSFHLIIVSKLMGMGLDIKKKIYGKAFGDNE